MMFAHLSDTHLGFRQYGIYEREVDFYRAFEKAVAAIIRKKPDFVIHSGDLFDYPKPPPRALWVAQRCFSKLREKGIPVYAITGNHDLLMRKGAMPPQALYADMGVRLLTEEDPFAVHEGVLIAGLPYRPKSHASLLKDNLATLSKKAGGYTKSVLVMHQGIDRYMRHGSDMSIGDIPGNFSYYAMGHIHARILESFGKGWLAYPGSTELWSSSEYDDGRKNGKGFYLVDLGGDMPQVQKVDIEPERNIIRKALKAAAADSEISKIAAEISALSAKPLLYLDVSGDALERPTIQDAVNSRLSPHALSVRVSYSAGREDKLQTKPFELQQIDDVIRETLGGGRKADLASLLFRHLSEGESEQAMKEAEQFFESVKKGKGEGGDSG
ncbi:MAG: DNA repair exonuclease [Candidatus Aenigmatarchaeota archaeon]